MIGWSEFQKKFGDQFSTSCIKNTIIMVKGIFRYSYQAATFCKLAASHQVTLENKYKLCTAKIMLLTVV